MSAPDPNAYALLKRDLRRLDPENGLAAMTTNSPPLAQPCGKVRGPGSVLILDSGRGASLRSVAIWETR
ncbi:hypothetical protein HRJ34_15435 [Rhizorhabdus wittichii]|uniref:Uncharacterized protein n=1 Tax=Rhizorhabdus wittichii TaxID=160791 RepID=A0A975CXU6_9SPHN|nr:hypothetical protein [Rhizorhabdus wittichii]QTH19760.1 hypothetical protein HRJ34_15435 [Rhizorhabdus wittichii]